MFDYLRAKAQKARPRRGRRMEAQTPYIPACPPISGASSIYGSAAPVVSCNIQSVCYIKFHFCLNQFEMGFCR